MNIVWGIYLGTIALSNVMFAIAEGAYQKRLEREGYRNLELEVSGIEKLKDIIELEFYMIIPIINIAFAAFTFFGDHYDDLLKEGLKDGSIIKKTQEEIEEEKALKNKKQRKKTNEIPVIKEETKQKTYLEMTNEEKAAVLKKELEWLQSINSREDSSSKPYNNHGVYRKKL